MASVRGHKFTLPSGRYHWFMFLWLAIPASTGAMGLLLAALKNGGLLIPVVFCSCVNYLLRAAPLYLPDKFQHSMKLLEAVSSASGCILCPAGEVPAGQACISRQNRQSTTLNNHGDALAYTDAHGAQRVSSLTAMQLINGSPHYTGATHSQRVP